MACDRYEKWLAESVLGDLSPQEDAELDAHLIHCATCRQQLERERCRVELIERSVAQSVSRGPSPEFEVKLLARLEEERAQPRPGWISSIRVGVGALALILVLVLWLTGSFKHDVRGRRVNLTNRLVAAPGSSGRTSATLAWANPYPHPLPLSRSREREDRAAVSEGRVRGSNLTVKNYTGHRTGPDMRVIVEPGQWTAVVQLYNAVRMGRVDGAPLLAKDSGLIRIKPIEISGLKIAPLEF